MARFAKSKNEWTSQCLSWKALAVPPRPPRPSPSSSAIDGLPPDVTPGNLRLRFHFVTRPRSPNKIASPEPGPRSPPSSDTSILHQSGGRGRGSRGNSVNGSRGGRCREIAKASPPLGLCLETFSSAKLIPSARRSRRFCLRRA